MAFIGSKKIAWTLGIPWLLFEAINELFSLTSIAPREKQFIATNSNYLVDNIYTSHTVPKFQKEIFYLLKYSDLMHLIFRDVSTPFSQYYINIICFSIKCKKSLISHAPTSLISRDWYQNIDSYDEEL